MSTLERRFRMLGVGWWFHIKYQMREPFVIGSTVAFPILFASATFFMFKAGHGQEGLLYAGLGAGLLAIWDATLFGSGGAIQEQRWIGTLELLVAAPTPLAASVAPLALATSSMGLVSFAATLAWGALAFRMPLTVADPPAFVVAMVATVFSLGLLGTVLASTFVRLRNANALSNMLTYPMALGAGLLVPLSLLPGWLRPVSWLLPPTWGVDAMRAAAFGGNAWPAIGACVATGVVYGCLGVVLLEYMERLAREDAALALA